MPVEGLGIPRGRFRGVCEVCLKPKKKRNGKKKAFNYTVLVVKSLDVWFIYHNAFLIRIRIRCF